MALVSLREVSIAFGGPAILDSVSLSIEKGERSCVTGRNGEGKSTLLKKPNLVKVIFFKLLDMFNFIEKHLYFLDLQHSNFSEVYFYHF